MKRKIGVYPREGSRYYQCAFVHPITKEYIRKTTKHTDYTKACEFYDMEIAKAWKETEESEQDKTDWTLRELIVWCESEFWTRRDGETPRSSDNRRHTLLAPLAELGDIKVTTPAKLFRQKIRDYRLKREKDVKRNTINREMTLMVYAFNRAIEEGYLSQNPFINMKTDESQFRRSAELKPGQRDLLITQSRGMLNKIIRFAFATGMRLGQIVQIQPEHLNFETRFVKTWTRKGGKLFYYFVPIDDALEVLMEMDLTKPYVFHNGKGEPIPKDGLVHAGFPRLCRRLKIPDFRFHDIRHEFATAHWRRYRDIVRTSTILGHRKIDTTMTYINVRPEDLIVSNLHNSGTVVRERVTANNGNN